MSDDDTYRSRFFNDETNARILAEHPQLKSGSPREYCPTCGTKGTYRWRGEKHVCDCVQQMHLHMHYLNAGIGTSYQRLDWEDYEKKGRAPIDDLVGKYIDDHKTYVNRGIGLFFTGDYGTGKTMVANLALKEFVKRGYRCYATTFAQTVEMFTAGWKQASEQRLFQQRFVNSEILLLDDVGRDTLMTEELGKAARRTSLPETTFDSILRTRVQYSRPTFMTTNLTEHDLEKCYGSAVFSLLREKSIQRDFTGDDFRRKANSRELEEIKNGEVRPIV